MILAIDMGNSNTVIGGIDEKRVYFQERIITPNISTSFEFAMTIKTLLELNGISPEEIDGAILASVVPANNISVIGGVKKAVNVECKAVDSSMNLGFDIKTDTPAETGADIIAGLAAAVKFYHLPAAVIDLGTATTIMIVDENKNFIGGIIHSGINKSIEALTKSTAKLPQITVMGTPDVIGTNTIDCMKSGFLYGHAGMIDSILIRMEAELGQPLTAIATGGLARNVIPLCGHHIVRDDNLLLKGLYELYKNN